MARDISLEQEWHVYTLSPDAEGEPGIAPLPDDVIFCDVDSSMAKDLAGTDPADGISILHPDLVMLECGLNEGAGASFGVLKEDWRGNPAGSFVIDSYEGMSIRALREGIARRTLIIGHEPEQKTQG